MATQRYTVTPHPIETLLTWVKSGEIAIPEIQRPFVWEATKVRNLLNSLYRGYPVGYLIAWRNPTVKLKDGSSSAGKRVLIDGQQRVTGSWQLCLGNKSSPKTTRGFEFALPSTHLSNDSMFSMPPLPRIRPGFLTSRKYLLQVPVPSDLGAHL
jgi:hypothetical protein